jgi:FkbM family methyltransferase
MTKRVELLAWLGARIGKPPGFERLARWIAPPGRLAGLSEICLVRDGMLFVAHPAAAVGWHVSLFGSYEPELRDIMRALLPPGGVAFDIGANVGWHTLLMARLVGAAGRVVAVEANPSICDELRRNLRLNRFGQVEILAHALGAAEDTMPFLDVRADDPGAASGHLVVSGDPGGPTVAVRVRPLDAVVREAGIERLDLIKLDVEGFEWPVLQGGRETIARFRPPVLFEYDAAYAARAGGYAPPLWEFFSGQGYRLYAVGRNWAERVELARWPDCANLLALPGEQSAG